MKMPKVSQCEVTECAFNQQQQCHALAIQVGGDHPMCDTFTPASNKAGDQSSIAGVGACKMSSCQFNRSLECTAKSIKVGHHGQCADCLTYSPK